MLTNETTNEITNEAPDFTAEWAQIREDHADVVAATKRVGENALRIGLTLMKIRDALKPRGLWLKALDEQDIMSPTQAWRYVTFAELSESDREIFLRQKGFSLTAAIGESPRKKKGEAAGPASDFSSTKSRDVEIPLDELEALRAEVDRRMKRAVEIVDAGVKALAGEPEPVFADDYAKWRNWLDEVREAVLAVIGEHLEAELRERLLPC